MFRQLLPPLHLDSGCCYKRGRSFLAAHVRRLVPFSTTKPTPSVRSPSKTSSKESFRKMVSLQDVMKALPANDNELSIRNILGDLIKMTTELRNGKMQDKDGNYCDIELTRPLSKIPLKITNAFDVWVQTLGPAVADKPVNLLDKSLYGEMQNGARRIAESIAKGEA